MMAAIPIESLSQAGSLDDALRDWHQVVEIAPSQRIGAGRGLTVLPRIPAYAHWETAYRCIEDVPPLRCHFLRDVEVCGDGYLLSNQHIILQKSYLSKVAFAGAHRDFSERSAENLFETTVIEAAVLMVIGPGWQVYGHWLLDFLPRVMIAKILLGERFYDFKLILPVDIPDFVKDMLSFFVKCRDDQFIYYDRSRQKFLLRFACVPDYAHYNYGLHSQVRNFYRSFISQPGKPWRRVCYSRRQIENTTLSAKRFFHEREVFEAQAIARDFELVCPEDLSFQDQIRLMAETSVQIGEHGSAQHSTIFAAPDIVVGTVHPMNNVQMQLGKLCNQKTIIMMADRQWTDDQGIIHFTASNAIIGQFLDEVEKQAQQSWLTELQSAP